MKERRVTGWDPARSHRRGERKKTLERRATGVRYVMWRPTVVTVPLPRQMIRDFHDGRWIVALPFNTFVTSPTLFFPPSIGT